MNNKNIKLNNGVELPRIGFGLWKVPNDESLVELMNTVIKTGINHFDSAAAYKNEVSVGLALEKQKSIRSKLFITSKVWTTEIRAKNTHAAFKKTLSDLKLEYLDLYLIHWAADGWQDAWKDMEEIYNKGEVKAIGVCNFQVHHLKTLAEIAKVKPAVNQIEINPYFTNKEVIDYCQKNDIVVESYSPLANGNQELLKDPILLQIAKDHGVSVPQVIFRWLYQQNVVAIWKSVTDSRIRQNADIFDFELSKEQMEQIDSLNKNKKSGADPDKFTF